jgi:DNA polymerase-3 subunit beta
MKFKVEQKALAKALSAAGKFIPSRVTHPVLANVKLVAFGGNLSIIAYDLSIGIELDCLSDVIERGEVTVSAKLFSDVISKAEGYITVELKDSILIITTAKGGYELMTIAASEYPALPEAPDKTFEIDSEVLKNTLKSVLFATSADETKQVLTGVNFAGLGDWWTLAATDGHRLATSEIGSKPEKSEKPDGIDTPEESEKPEEELVDLTIPARALKELDKLLSTGDVEIFYAEGQGAVKLPGVYLTFRTLEGQYPAYSQLIPRSFERTATLNRKDFLAALERISVLSDRKNNIIQAEFNASSQQLVLSVEAADVGSGQEVISIQLAGEPINVGFNAKYIKESIAALTSEVIQINLNSNTSPLVVNPLGTEKVTHLIMPVQMRA